VGNAAALQEPEIFAANRARGLVAISECDGEARKNMKGELSPALHVFSAATSSQKPGSNRSQNVTPVAVSTPLANLVKVPLMFSVSRP
jgi:hypothetical protein